MVCEANLVCNANHVHSNGRHFGVDDPIAGERIKPAVPGRKIDVWVI